MLATLNVEKLVWTVKTPPKAYIHYQEMVEEGADGTSISLNPTKNRTTRRGGEWL